MYYEVPEETIDRIINNITNNPNSNVGENFLAKTDCGEYKVLKCGEKTITMQIFDKKEDAIAFLRED